MWHFLGLMLFLVACSTTPKQTKAGRQVKIVKNPIPEHCLQVGTLKYDGTPFVDAKELSIIMREMAAEMNANAIRFDILQPGVQGSGNARGRGTVFKCRFPKSK